MRVAQWIGSAFAMAAVSAASPAQAGCYEIQGCTNERVFSEQFLMENAECQILWEIRNGIYKENGLCFRTPRAISTFGNAGCTYDDPAAVPLNRFERANIEIIRRVERRKGCPG